MRQGRRKPQSTGLLSVNYLAWARVQPFDQPAQREVLNHYVLELEHSSQRLRELKHAVDDVCQQLPKPTAALVAALQALRGWPNCWPRRWSASWAVFRDFAARGNS